MVELFYAGKFYFIFFLSLFLLISTVSAQEIVSDDSIAILYEEQSLDSDCLRVNDSSILSEGEDSSDSNTSSFGDEDGLSSDSNTSSFDDGDGVSSDFNALSSNDLNNDQNSNNYSSKESSCSSNNTNNSSVDISKVPYKFSSTKNIASTYGKKVNFSVKVLNKYGKPINHTLVTFKVFGKTYKVYTNLNGISTIGLNLNAGKYTISYSTANISGKNTYAVKNYFKITIYKWKSGANVLKNKRIKMRVPNSLLVKRMIKAARYGTPVIKFKGGNGKAVFISAGCHGSELPSQVAAMKMIHYLEKHHINGTVYVMPFMNPKATAANVRNYKGISLNTLANKKGSISYKTVALIKKFKCSAYGDFHSSMPGGNPGKNVAMGTYIPTKKSASLAKYIAKNAKVKILIYKRAGTVYPGALEDQVNLKGIPAVTCEVLSPHGKIKAGSISKSLLMMKSLLRNYKIIK